MYNSLLRLIKKAQSMGSTDVTMMDPDWALNDWREASTAAKFIPWKAVPAGFNWMGNKLSGTQGGWHAANQRIQNQVNAMYKSNPGLVDKGSWKVYANPMLVTRGAGDILNSNAVTEIAGYSNPYTWALGTNARAQNVLEDTGSVGMALGSVAKDSVYRFGGNALFTPGASLSSRLGSGALLSGAAYGDIDIQRRADVAVAQKQMADGWLDQNGNITPQHPDFYQRAYDNNGLVPGEAVKQYNDTVAKSGPGWWSQNKNWALPVGAFAVGAAGIGGLMAKRRRDKRRKETAGRGM